MPNSPQVTLGFSRAKSFGLSLKAGIAQAEIRLFLLLPLLAQVLGEGRRLFLTFLCPAGKRWSSASAYLHPALSRPNLKAESRTLVSRVLFEGTRAVGVEYVKNGQSHKVSGLQGRPQQPRGQVRPRVGRGRALLPAAGTCPLVREGLVVG